MNEAWVPIIVQILILLAGIPGGVWAVRKEIAGRKETRIDRLNERIDAEIERQDERYDRVLKENDELRKQLIIWAEGALILYRQALREGREPAWVPPRNGNGRAPEENQE